MAYISNNTNEYTKYFVFYKYYCKEYSIIQMRVQREHKSRFLADINQYNSSKVYGATHV